MFSSKKIRELEAELEKKDREINKLKNELDVYRIKVADMEAYSNTTPPDCVRGNWCKACEFVKPYYIRGYLSSYSDTIYVCGKGKSCEHFVPKGEN